MLNDVIEVIDIQYYIELDGAEYAVYEEQNLIELTLVTQQGIAGINGSSEFIWTETQW